MPVMVKKPTRLLGLALGIVFVIIAFSQVRWDLFYLTVVSLNIWWVGLVALALFLAMYLRAVRWYLIMGLPRSEFLKVWDASCIGYLGTAIYPARAGDVLRMLRLFHGKQPEFKLGGPE